VNKLNNPDNEPTQNSEGLVKSGGVFAWFGAAVSTLKTAAKNVVGAINWLFDNTVKTSENQTINGVKTFGSIPVLPASDPQTDNHAVRRRYVDNAINYVASGTIIGTVNQGSGTVVDTPQRTDINLWEFLQLVWNRIFALNNLKANDTAVVKLTGNQTISGTKTFNTSPPVPNKTTAAGNNATVIATEAQVALKANNSQATLNAGSGTDISTPEISNPTVWGMIQNIWNRIFAINIVRIHNLTGTISTIRGFLYRHGTVVTFFVEWLATASVTNYFTPSGGFTRANIPLGYRPRGVITFPIYNVTDIGTINAASLQTYLRISPQGVVTSIAVTNTTPSSLWFGNGASGSALRAQISWTTEDTMPSGNTSG